MLDQYKETAEPESRHLQKWRRLKLTIVGCVLAVVLGLALAFVYTSTRYGGTALDRFFGKEEPKNPNVGKQAFSKESDIYLGVIKGEGYSARRRTQVYYIERAGGQVIEVPKELVSLK